MRRNNTLIKINDLNVIFGDQAAISDVNLNIQHGEFIGLIGPNGAGKSTLLRAILGLNTNIKGKVTIAKDCHIGYVPQSGIAKNQQIPMSVAEIVGLETPRLNRREIITRALDEISMSEYINRPYKELSGGQQQRVLIAKALVGNPNLMILDEPTTGIDEQSQKIFFNILRRLQSKGITIIMVSHDVEMVLSLVTRVVCLNRTVLYDGKPSLFDLATYIPETNGSRHLLLHHPKKGI